MVSPKSKKRSPALFFVGAFVAIMAVIFVANRRSPLANEIRFPFNNGVAYISTCGHYLTAVCRDNKIYVWDWGDLSKEAVTSVAESDQARLLDGDHIISVKRRDASQVVIANIRQGKGREEIAVDGHNKRAYLGTNHRGTMTAIIFTEADSETNRQRYQVVSIESEDKQVLRIAEITEDASDSRLTRVVVSGDGKYVACMSSRKTPGKLPRKFVTTRDRPKLQRFTAKTGTNLFGSTTTGESWHLTT